MARLISSLVKFFPGLKRNLLMAHMKESPENFLKKALVLSLIFSITATIFLIIILRSQMKTLSFVPLFFTAVFVFSLYYILNIPKIRIRQRERDIEREVLFAGRYILVKLESGNPLFNTLIDASKSYGVAGKYFKEIVDDINTGTPIEVALDNARKYNPSHNFRLILWQIITALKSGAEVTESLKNTLNRIMQEQIIEIKEYGRKLNSLVMFYMVIACVMPSIGLTILVILSSFLSLEITSVHLFSVLFFVSFLQLLFIFLIKSARPTVNL